MKQLILLAVVLTSGLAHAKTICTLDAGNPKKDMVFDRVLYTGEVTAGKYLSYRQGDTVAHEIDFNHLTYDQWKALDGSAIVTFGPTAGGTFGITVSHVELANSSTIDPLDAIAFGQPTGQIGLNLIVPSQELSANCISIQ